MIVITNDELLDLKWAAFMEKENGFGEFKLSIKLQNKIAYEMHFHYEVTLEACFSLIVEGFIQNKNMLDLREIITKYDQYCEVYERSLEESTNVDKDLDTIQSTINQLEESILQDKKEATKNGLSVSFLREKEGALSLDEGE